MPFSGAKVILNPFTGELDVVAPDTVILHFGAERLGSSTTTRYLYPGHADGMAELSVHELRSPRAGTLGKLFIQQNESGGGPTILIYGHYDV